MAQAHILVGSESEQSHLSIRRISPADLVDALAKGWDDFCAMPSHAVFLCVVYPIIGIALAGLTLGYALLPLLYPLAAGFALLGPIAAVGLYELSRRREAGLDISATDAFDVWRSPSIGAIVALGVLLMLLFLIWVATANDGHAIPEPILNRMNVYEVSAPDRDAARTIALRLYQSIRRDHDWGSRFDPEPSASVLDAMSELAPREMRRAWMTAFGNAKLDRRCAVEVRDLPAAQGRRAPIGLANRLSSWRCRASISWRARKLARRSAGSTKPPRWRCGT